MASSTHTALGIPEILEMILLNLDMRRLLCIQRTCRSWLSMIRDSSPLQKALYFTPIENPAGQEKVQNPLSVEAFPALFKLTDPDNSEDDYEYDEPTLAAFDMMKTPSKLATYLRPEASWRRMLLQQPPMCNFAVCRYSTGGYGFSHAFCEVPEDSRGFADGLRMGDFFEALLFSDDVRFATCRLKRVIWWKRIPQSGLSIWNKMEQLMGRTLGSDIVVSLRSHTTRCHDSDDDDETPEDEKAMDRIKAAYKELGIHPRRLGKTNKWSHSDWWE